MGGECARCRRSEREVHRETIQLDRIDPRVVPSSTQILVLAVQPLYNAYSAVRFAVSAGADGQKRREKAVQLAVAS